MEEGKRCLGSYRLQSLSVVSLLEMPQQVHQSSANGSNIIQLNVQTRFESCCRQNERNEAILAGCVKFGSLNLVTLL